MKITKQRLKQIIKEELEAVMSERFDPSKQVPKKLTYVKMTKKGREYRYKVGNSDKQVEANYYEVDNTGYTALSLGRENGFFLDKDGVNRLTLDIQGDTPETKRLMIDDLKRSGPAFSGQFEEMMQEREKLKQDIKRKQDYERKNYGKVLTQDLPGE